MLGIRTFLLFLLGYIFPSLLWAGSFTAYVDKTVGTIEDQFILTLTVSGLADKKPHLSPIDGMEVSSAGTSHSTSWVNGVVTREVQYRYILIPTREGSYQIPSISLEVDGDLQRTLPIALVVKKSSDAQVQKSHRDIFIERNFSKDTVYVGEQVIETIKVFYKVKLLEAAQGDATSLDFSSFPLGKERNYRQVVNGQSYNVTQIKRAIIPLRAKDIEIPRFVLNAVIAVQSSRNTRNSRSFFDDFFSMTGKQVRKRVASDSFLLKVKSLPPPPANTTNLEVVGNFKISASLSKRKLTTSESATLTINISGSGNLQGMKPVDLSFRDIKVYADKPQIKVVKDVNKGLHSEAVLKVALLPTAGGKIQLGNLKLAYFNPAMDNFQTTTVALGTLEVEKTKNDQRVVVGGNSTLPKSTVKVLGADLITIHRGEQLLEDHSFSISLRLKLLFSVVFLLFVFAVSYVYLKFFRSRHISRRSRAYRLFKKAQLSLAKSGSLLDNVSRIDKNFRGYLGDKFDMQGLSATTAEIHLWLKSKNIVENILEQIVSHLQRLEKILFADQKTDDKEFANLVAETNRLVKEVEKKC